MEQLDLVVIGRGLFGAAAWRHLAGTGHDVTVIGPSEPADWSRHSGVFASHYDEGRITRVLDRNSVWAQLAQAAIARYPEITAASGVQFYDERGFLGLSRKETGLVQRLLEVAAELGVDAEYLDQQSLQERFPALHAPDCVGAWQPTGAGHISPRKLVAAQTGAAMRAGGKMIQDWVRSVRLVPDGVEIELADETVRARRVLVATGAFTEPSLLADHEIPIAVQGRTVVVAQVSARLRAELGDALNALPSMFGHGMNLPGAGVRTAAGASSAASELLEDWYALPPIRYPNGQVMVKIGTGSFSHPLADLAEKRAWFQGEPAAVDMVALRARLVALLPALAQAPVSGFNCAYTGTDSGYPYIDWVVPERIAVCVGGNGAGAKSSDEIGRLGAELLTGTQAKAPFVLPRA